MRQKEKARLCTDWFPVGTPPVRSGWYQIAYGRELLTYGWWDNFNLAWRFKLNDRILVNFGEPQDSWRGLSTEAFWSMKPNESYDELIKAVTRLQPHRKMFI
jgi:hypothetical protein